MFRKGNKKRQYKNTKYGFGGRKRGTKGNTKASYDNIDGKYKKVSKQPVLKSLYCFKSLNLWLFGQCTILII